MALPTIRYATTRDSIRVAFHTLGRGPAVVMLFPYHVNHLALNWRVPPHRAAIESLARHFTVVNLDFRGSGLSERQVAYLSLEAFAEDLDAVLAELRIERVALCAMGPAGLVACHFAARARPRHGTGLHRKRGVSDRGAVQRITRFLGKGFGVEAEMVRVHQKERRARVELAAGLSGREAEVLRLLSADKANQQIADELFISDGIVTIAFGVSRPTLIVGLGHARANWG